MDALLSIVPNGPISFSLPSHSTQKLNLSNVSINPLAVIPVCSSGLVDCSSQLILLEAFQEFSLNLSFTLSEDRCWQPEAVLRIYAMQLEEEIPETLESLNSDANHSLITKLLNKYSKLQHHDITLFCALQPPLLLLPTAAHLQQPTLYEVNLIWPKKIISPELLDPLNKKLATLAPLKRIYSSPLKVVVEFICSTLAAFFLEIQISELPYIFRLSKMLPLGNLVSFQSTIVLVPFENPNSCWNEVNLQKQSQSDPSPTPHHILPDQQSLAHLQQHFSKPFRSQSLESSPRQILDHSLSNNSPQSRLIPLVLDHPHQSEFQKSYQKYHIGQIINHSQAAVIKTSEDIESKLEPFQPSEIIRQPSETQETPLKDSEEPLKDTEEQFQPVERERQMGKSQSRQLQEEKKGIISGQEEQIVEENSQRLEHPIECSSIPRINQEKDAFEQNRESSAKPFGQESSRKSSNELFSGPSDAPLSKVVQEYGQNSAKNQNQVLMESKSQRVARKSQEKKQFNSLPESATRVIEANAYESCGQPADPKAIRTAQSSAVINIEEPPRKIEEVKNFEMPGTVLNILMHGKKLYILMYDSMLMYDLETNRSQQPLKRYNFEPLDDTQIKPHTPMIRLTLFPALGSSSAPVPLLMFANDSSLYYINLTTSHSDWKYVQRKEIFCLESLSMLNAVLVGGRNFSKLSYIGKATVRSNVKVYSLGSRFDHVYTYDLQGSSNGDVNGIMRIPATAINWKTNIHMTELMLIHTSSRLHILEVIGLREIVTLLQLPIVDTGLQSIIRVSSTAEAIYILEDLEIARCVKKLGVKISGREEVKLDISTENSRLTPGSILQISKIGVVGLAALYTDGKVEYLIQQVSSKIFSAYLQHPVSKLCSDEQLSNGGDYIALLNGTKVTLLRREFME